MQFLQRFIGRGLPMAEKLTELYHCVGGRSLSHKNLRIQPLFLAETSREEILKSVTTIEVFSSYPLLGRYLQISVESPEYAFCIQESQCGFR